MWKSNVFYFLRDSVHRAADQSCGSHRSHSDGAAVGVWCRQLSIHVHVLLPQVRPAGSFCFSLLCCHQEPEHQWGSVYYSVRVSGDTMMAELLAFVLQKCNRR